MLDVKDRLTYADYMKTSDDERYELLNGELIMSPSPREIHQYISGNLYLVLGAFVRDRSLGRVYFFPFRCSAVGHGRGAAGPVVRL